MRSGRSGRWGGRAGVAEMVAGVTAAVLAVVLLVVAGPVGPAGASGPAVVSVGSVSVVEGDLTSAGSVQARVPILLSAPQAGDVVVQYSTGTGSATAGVDYAPRVNKTIKLPAGRTSATVPVMIWGDTDTESKEEFSVQLTGVLAGGVGIDAATGTGTVTILDDDPGSGPRLGVADHTVVETDAGETSVSLNLTLSEPVAADETIQVTITSPTPGVTITRPTGTLTLTNNDTAISTLWAWGYNVTGQLGLGDTTNRTSPTQVGTASDWVAVTGGWSHTVAPRS